jgi:hypothetical protein
LEPGNITTAVSTVASVESRQEGDDKDEPVCIKNVTHKLQAEVPEKERGSLEKRKIKKSRKHNDDESGRQSPWQRESLE